MKIKEVDHETFSSRPKGCEDTECVLAAYEGQKYWGYEGPCKNYYDTMIDDKYYRISSRRRKTAEDAHRELKEYRHASVTGV